MTHETITKLLASHFSLMSATRLWVRTTWSTDSTPQQTWIGCIDPPWRHTRVGPWDVTWTHQAQDTSHTTRFEKQGHPAPYIGKLPRKDIVYHLFDITQEPTTPTPQRATSAAPGTLNIHNQRAVASSTITIPVATSNARLPPPGTTVAADTTPLPRNPPPAVPAQRPHHDRHASPDSNSSESNSTDSESDEDDNDDSAWDRLAAPPSQDLAPLFQLGNSAVPAVALMMGHNLLSFLANPLVKLPSLVRTGMAPGTRSAHRGALNLLSGIQPQLPLIPAILKHLSATRTIRKWRHSTFMRYLCSTQGALSALPLYRTHTHPIHLQRDPTWQSAIRSAGIAAKEEQPQQPLAASLTETSKALALEPSLPHRVAIILAWVTCARVGCILQLKVEDISTSLPDNTISVTFRRGKSVRTRGPYTVHTAVTTAWMATINRWIATRKSFIFPTQLQGKDIKLSLRRAHPRLEQRSLRRGSLQHLARSGVSEETLMLFSGHTQITTLRRYLNWGQIGSQKRDLMTQKGSALLPPDFGDSLELNPQL